MLAASRLEEFQRAAELRAALRSFLRASEQVARRHRLTPQRYTLLLMIKGAPDGNQRSTVTELSHRLQLAQSTVTELVRRAESVGLIRREPSPRDGRVAYLSLTEEGERRLAGAVSDLGPEQARLAAVLDDRVVDGNRAA
jgi:DNA-binding MarR family transcriptional regulator